MEVHLEDTSYLKGSKIPLLINYSEGERYQNLQIEVYDTSVRNPSSKLSFGTPPEKLGDNKFRTNIDTSHLDHGVFEIKLVRFSNFEDDQNPEQIDFISARDFDRVLFEVIVEDQDVTSKDELYKRTLEKEESLEKEFLMVNDARLSADIPSQQFCVIVYLKGILIGTRIRFKNFEILPTGKGIDDLDQLNFVNDHLKDQTKINIVFKYEQVLQNRAHSLNPVCVMHFPRILANDQENAREYCQSKAEKLISTFSLTRGASGDVFDIVVYNPQTKQARKYAERGHYVGNLLTGGLAGEQSETVEKYITSLESNPFNEFMVGLHKDAKKELSPDFQYVRYWQILEVLAENQDYDPSEPLLDFDGNEMFEGERALQSKGSVNIVFRLLKENGLGTTENTRENVNIWFALRNAVAHHGAISKYTELKRQKVKCWAEIGFNEIENNPTQDGRLWTLREDVKLLLMRLLGSGPSNV